MYRFSKSVLRRQQNVFRSPERLCANKIDAVLRHVAFALARIELEFHDAVLAAPTHVVAGVCMSLFRSRRHYRG